jgi:hypothetical protein
VPVPRCRPPARGEVPHPLVRLASSTNAGVHRWGASC